MATALFMTLGPFQSGGVFLDAAKLYHYNGGTTTLLNLWADRGETVTLAQPLVSDANGIFAFYGDGLYKFVLTDDNGAILYTWDNILIQDPELTTLGPGPAIASASVLNVGPMTAAHITGSVTIHTLSGSIPYFYATFDSSLTIAYSSTLITPALVDMFVQAGDILLFLNEGAGIWRVAICSRWASYQDGRTNTVAAPLNVQATTLGAPAIGIGTGILLQAQSADETPSNFGQLQVVASDVTAGSEDTYWELLVRVAGAALAATYRFTAATGFRSIFLHSNAADRTYVLPDFSGIVVVGGANNANVASGDLKTASGSAVLASVGSEGAPTTITANVAMNDFSFFPSISATSYSEIAPPDPLIIGAWSGADPSDTVGRLRISAFSDGAGAGGTTTVRWRYITASDDSTICVAIDGANLIRGSWVADDPLPNGVAGITIPGCMTMILKSSDLESWTILTTHAAAAADLIKEKHMKMSNQAFRALQLLTGDQAPANWILNNCVYSKGAIGPDDGKIKANLDALAQAANPETP